MNALKIEIVDNPSLAPNYNRDELETRAARIDKCIIVGKGTVEGNPTVDFHIFAEDGSKFVAMLTGNLVKSLAATIEGFEQRGKA
jgi:hypothetical protein